MWIDDIPSNRGWDILWGDKILCECGAIREIHSQCPVCQKPPYSCDPSKIILDDGEMIEVPACFPGAEGRFEDYIYLQMMEREWHHPTIPAANNSSLLIETSQKASIVLLFWTYFETRIERLIRMGLKGTPPKLVEDILDRYSSIGSRLDRLYRVIFETSYGADLESIGVKHIWDHLCKVKAKRNEFMHGDPMAINDSLVYSIVEHLKDEHDAWIQIFNKRLASREIKDKASVK